MSSDPVDQWFARYRATGRPTYLARVFDETAPELLRVALQTQRDPAQAEDLVQNTFVVAIRSVRRFEVGSRVLPWLVGILGRLALEQRRDDRRAPDPGRLGRPARPIDPLESAQSREFEVAVDRVLKELDDPYRSVLVLHLRHGLAPAEIADALKRSPGTVRSQLARGLQRLREYLPAGFVGTGLFATLLPGCGLAAVRSAILAKTKLLAPWIALRSLGGAAAAQPAAVAVVTVMFLCLAWSLVVGQSKGLNSTDTGAMHRSSGFASGPRSSDSRTLGRRTERVRLERTVLGAGKRERRRSRLVVCVRGVAGRGVKAVAVRIRPCAAVDPMLSEQWAVTDDGGNAAFSEIVPGRYQVRLDRMDGPEVVVTRDQEAIATVDLAKGRDVRGRVVDCDRRPIPFASIWLGRDGLANYGIVAGRADSRGEFAIEGVAENRAVAALAPGFRPCAPVLNDDSIRATQLESGLVLVLDHGAVTVSGRVLDPEGQPVAGALVRIGDEGPPFHLLDRGIGEPTAPSSLEPGAISARAGRFVSNRLPITVRTDLEGRFETRSASVGSKVPVYVRAAGFAGTQRVLDLNPRSPVDLDLRLERGGSLVGAITANGAGVENVLVRANLRHSGVPSWFRASARTDAAGRYRLSGLRPGSIEVSAFGGSRGVLRTFVTSDCQKVATWNGDFDAVAMFTGRVRTVSGRLRSDLLVRTNGRSIAVVDGQFALPVSRTILREIEVLDVRCRVPALVSRRRDVRGHEVDLVVPDLGTPSSVRGVVVDGTGRVLPDATVALRHVDLLDSPSAFPVAGVDGRFAVDGLTPGTYELLVRAPGVADYIVPRLVLRSGQTLDVGTIRLEHGGRVRILVERGGKPFEGLVNVVIRNEREDQVLRRNRVAPGFVTPRLSTGEYRVVVWNSAMPMVAQRVRIDEDEVTARFDASGGVVVRVVVEGLQHSTSLDTISAQVKWRRDSGEELANDQVSARSADELVAEQKLEPGSYILGVEGADGRSASAKVVVGSVPLEIRVTVGR